VSYRVAFGRMIEHFRRERGWSGEQLAQLADVSTRYVYEVESGNANVTADVQEALLKALPAAEVFLALLVQPQMLALLEHLADHIFAARRGWTTRALPSFTEPSKKRGRPRRIPTPPLDSPHTPAARESTHESPEAVVHVNGRAWQPGAELPSGEPWLPTVAARVVAAADPPPAPVSIEETAGDRTLRTASIRHAREVLSECGGKKMLASKKLGVSYRTLCSWVDGERPRRRARKSGSQP